MKSEKSDVIALLGTLPPLRGLSSYCREFALALADTRPVAFISFNKLYPASLYPGGGLKEDVSFPVTEHGNLTVRRCLCWYNPLTWLFEGLLTPGILLHAQWWSLPLANQTYSNILMHGPSLLKVLRQILKPTIS
jgi:hypothetical protein